MKRVESILEWGGIKRDIVFLIISSIFLVLSMFSFVSLPFHPAWIAILLCGVPIILEAVVSLVTEFDIRADVLVSIALIASIIIGEVFAAGEIAVIMQLGALLEEVTVSKAKAGIEKLVHFVPQTARKVTDEGEEIISADQVQVGDILRVLPGETIPADGRIIWGQTSVNQAVMTGESLPVDKGEGDEVSSGTVNQFGSFDMKAFQVGEDSSIQRMIRLVQSADAGKTKVVGIADRMATWVVVIALAAAVVTGLCTGELIRAVTILVVFCPCALVLATPTAVVAAIGNCTKHGFLVKEGDALERLADVSEITFDKTGTLTYGEPQVIAVTVFGELSEEELYAYAAGVEVRSEHPLGKAILRCYEKERKEKDRICGKKMQKEEVPFYEPEQFRMIPGRGVQAMINGKNVIAGNESLLREENAVLTGKMLDNAAHYQELGCTLVWIAMDKKTEGFLALSDTVREDAADTIRKIKKAGLRPVLLTGDQEFASKNIAGQLHIDQVYPNCLPEDKLEFIEECQKANRKICMIGDGMNDAPALKKSNVGIAMGGIGSDIAIDAADIALVNDDIRELPHLIFLAKKMMVTIKRNLTFSMALNVVSILLAIAGILNPVAGALVHNAGSVFVIINSITLLSYKEPEWQPGIEI